MHNCKSCISSIACSGWLWMRNNGNSVKESQTDSSSWAFATINCLCNSIIISTGCGLPGRIWIRSTYQSSTVIPRIFFAGCSFKISYLICTIFFVWSTGAGGVSVIMKVLCYAYWCRNLHHMCMLSYKFRQKEV